jgi:putative ABC transport system permease protein
MALGAARRDVLSLILRTGMQLVAFGVVVGIAASVVATHVMASQLEGAPAFDIGTLGIVVVLVTVAGIAACFFPARRATKVDPMVALRCE